MPETHDVGRVFVTRMVYPPLALEELPHYETGAVIREVEEPYRIGAGFTVRLPFLRHAVVFGWWQDRGGDEVERLTAALGASDTHDGADEIRSW